MPNAIICNLCNRLSGHRLVSSSTGGNLFLYGATCFAVAALAEATRRELRQENSHVKVTVSMLWGYLGILVW